ncbi:Late embryogenesis abundant (LEA) hydroxyproline-rich glycoprotein family [Arabidopsis thaliana]|uniref:Late embryogenesis abundant (LEA) hydroxyproline-rich glycoprotein family n=1 Tax=Arabidopsis thaliana TaxID=3702 RepID=F4JPE5_ARATH|nr:Late embryogenesis abundant (LEA) hydroxyproline-rich glycoprotein family [Arabidopsis thaliana]AEE84828.1 Late embryogenesis abundant (LEA) hydroxyproline-rich glycoprotein family [Arabidopsis thaliana]|eukprot:NP_974603.1 Late embryogenesis abundant (LEA) hydroxyproline-rich glycoprotein family [Arabidopsis thaliana]
MSKSCSNLASCAVATLFIVFLIIAALTVYLTVFRPRDPEISVTSVKVPSFSVANSSLFYYGNRIGYTFVPAGEIESGRTKRMLATFSVQSFPLAAASSSQISAAQFQNSDRSGSTVEIESKLEMAGRVRVLGLFTHRIAAKCNCRIAISSSDGSIVAVRC